MENSADIDSQQEEATRNADKVAEIAECFASAKSTFERQYDDARDDLVFAGGQQWDDQVRTKRGARPCITLNMMPKFIKRITNTIRTNPPAIKVSPVSGGIDKKTAEIFQALIRTIEAQSDAQSHYVTAAEQLVIGGFSWLKVSYDYAEDDSMEMDAKIHSVRDPLCVYLDPSSVALDGSDAKWAIELEWTDLDSVKAKYGDDVTGGDWGAPNVVDNVKDKDRLCVMHYWYVEESPDNLLKVSFVDPVIGTPGTPQVIRESESLDRLSAQPALIHGSRPVTKRTIRYCVATPTHVLEEGEWPGKMLPFVPVYGEAYRRTDNTYSVKGLVRDERETQIMVNWYASFEAEAMAVAPKAPFLVTDEQVNGHAAAWRDMNIKDTPYLPYKHVDGQPPPQRMSASPDVSPVMAARVRAMEDMKEISGIFDFVHQMTEKNESGKAVLLRRQASDLQISDWSDRLNRAVRRVGQCLVDLVPKVYSDARVKRLTNEDGTSFDATLNQQYVDEQGMQQFHDLTVGRYEVSVSSGPAYSTRRQESADMLLNVMQTMPPEKAGLLTDIAIRNIDAPGMDKAADRLMKTLPPELQDGDKSANLDPQTKAMLDQQAQALQQAQATMEGQQGKIEELMGVIAQLQQQVENKTQDNQTKLAIAEMDNNTKVAVESIKAGNNIDLAQHNGLTEMGKAFAQASASVKSPNITPIAHKRIPQVAGPVSAQGQSAEGMAT